MDSAAELKNVKARDTNIELLRIIAMLMILSMHYLSRGDGLTQNTTFSLNWFFSWTVYAISAVAVNCYVLISGYFLVTSRFKLKKLLKLWIQILFYSITIYLVLSGIGLEHFTIKHMVMACIPVLTNQYWFATLYLALYAASPFLNILINAMNKKQFQNLLLILILILSVWPTVLPFGYSLDKTNGYSIIQFVFIYIIGAYIRLHWNFELKKSYYAMAYGLITILLVASKTLFTYFGLQSISEIFYSYNSVTVVLSSVMLFIYFRSISVMDALVNKAIASVSALTFGIYLIHENIFLRGILYKKILHADLLLNTPLFIPAAVGTISGIFAASMCIDAVRKKIFMIFEGSRFSNTIQQNISAMTAKFSSVIQEKIAMSLNSPSNQ